MSTKSGRRVAKSTSAAECASAAGPVFVAGRASVAGRAVAADRTTATSLPADAPERYGPVVVERRVKRDGRVLLLYSRAAEDEI